MNSLYNLIFDRVKTPSYESKPAIKKVILSEGAERDSVLLLQCVEKIDCLLLKNKQLENELQKEKGKSVKRFSTIELIKEALHEHNSNN